MKILHYDCFAGISGDMNLAALIDLGVDEKKLCAELKKLKLDGWKIETSKDSRGGVWGTRIDVHCRESCAEHHPHSHCVHSDENDHSHAHVQEHSHKPEIAHSDSAKDFLAAQHLHCHRSFADIKNIINSSKLSKKVKETSLKIFENLARAEGEVHNKKYTEVNFHEVGAVDSIIDIVGAAVCFELLGIEKITSSPVELGGGTVRCAHGIMPVPAPATALLAKNFAFKIGGASHECTTPTGAAIIATLAKRDEASKKSAYTSLGTGIGIGHRECAELPNFLRVILLECDENFSGGSQAKSKKSEKKILENSLSLNDEILVEFAANIDDMSAEEISFLCSKLFDCGALDVWQQAILMKKNRLGTKVCALSKMQQRKKILDCYFENSSTLGVRSFEVSRTSLPRVEKIVRTRFGKVRVKISSFGNLKKFKADYDDIAEASRKKNISFGEASQKISEDFLKDEI